MDSVLFCYRTGSAPITAGTPHRWGAVISKPRSTWLEGTPAIDLGNMNVVLKWMYLFVGNVFRMWNVVLE